MRGLVVHPGVPHSLHLRDDLPEPTLERAMSHLLVECSCVGVCGTDREIVEGRYGEAPSGQSELVIGHESLGRVLVAAADGFRAGDWVVGIVRRPDPVPCACCAQGEWDMCMNGRYTERGIRGAHGYASERFVIEPEFAVRVPEGLGITAVLLEPASVVAKAWEQVERIAARSSAFSLHEVLITGAGPIGLLAALLATQRGYDVTVLDRASGGPKPELVQALGARFHTGTVAQLAIKPEIVIECTGSDALVVDVLGNTAHNSIVCLAGVSSGARKVRLFASQFNDSMVLENDVVFGSVNANRRHYALALEALAQADRAWLERLITRRVAVDRFEEAFRPQPHDVKVVVSFD